MLVRTLRRERSWTQEQLALILGVDVRTVQRLEGGAMPSLETAQALASAFDCDARAFLGEPAATASPAEGGPGPAQVRSEPAVHAAVATSAPPRDPKPGTYAMAYLLVGSGLASILILTLLIAGPSSPALIAPLFVSAMCVALILSASWRRRGDPPQGAVSR